MEIAGARASLDAYASYCDDNLQWDCGWYAGGKAYVDDEAVSVDKVDLRKIDKARFEQSNLDRRIKAAVLVDPVGASLRQPEPERHRYPHELHQSRPSRLDPGSRDRQQAGGADAERNLRECRRRGSFELSARMQGRWRRIAEIDRETDPVCEDGATDRAPTSMPC